MTRHLLVLLTVLTVAALSSSVDRAAPRPQAAAGSALTPRSSASPPTPRATPTRASRSRRLLAGRHPEGSTVPSGTGTGSTLDVTAYCWTGHRTASGVWPAPGMAAGNAWPLGTHLHVEHVGDVTITDRIGHGSDLDIYLGRDGCHNRAATFGRRHLHVQVIS